MLLTPMRAGLGCLTYQVDISSEESVLWTLEVCEQLLVPIHMERKQE